MKKRKWHAKTKAMVVMQGLNREVTIIIIKTIIFTIFFPGSVAILGPYLLLTSGIQFSYEIGSFRLIGIIPIALGVALYILSAWDFAFAGKGTPAPTEPPKILVSRRLYRINRNPMYTGGALVLIGEAILFASLTLAAYALLVWTYFHLFAIYYEEPHLKKKFGAVYEEYCKAVPRWIPGFKGANRNA
jgi:protein-S-isoprenylcysteine O-methyltransferase Ste14